MTGTPPRTPGPGYAETTDIGACVVQDCGVVADSITRDAECGCSQTVVNCMAGHKVIISIIQPACLAKKG